MELHYEGFCSYVFVLYQQTSKFHYHYNAKLSPSLSKIIAKPPYPIS